MHEPHSGLADSTIVQLQQFPHFEINNDDNEIYQRLNATMATLLNTTPMTLSHAANAGFIGTLVARFKAYRVYRNSLNELRALSNRELADLGLSRSMIKRIALEAAYDGI